MANEKSNSVAPEDFPRPQGTGYRPLTEEQSLVHRNRHHPRRQPLRRQSEDGDHPEPVIVSPVRTNP